MNVCVLVNVCVCERECACVYIVLVFESMCVCMHVCVCVCCDELRHELNSCVSYSVMLSRMTDLSYGIHAQTLTTSILVSI